MAENLDSYADRTRKDRFRLHVLVQGGIDESKALIQIFPKDGNRKRTLKKWKEKGLYPIPVEELQQYGSQFDKSKEVSTTKIPETTSEQVGNMVDTTSNLVQTEATNPAISTVEGVNTTIILETTSNKIDEVVETTSNIVVTEVTNPEVEGVCTSDEKKTIIESQVEKECELVEPTIKTTQNILGGLVVDNPEEIQAMMDQLLSLYRRGKLAELKEKPIESSPRQTFPPMPQIEQKPLSIYSSQNLRRMAEAKAQQDPNLPAGTKWNISNITNYLLWQYLGCPSREEIEGFSER